MSAQDPERILIIATARSLPAVQAAIEADGADHAIAGVIDIEQPDALEPAFDALDATLAVICLPASLAGERTQAFDLAKANGLRVSEIPPLSEALNGGVQQSLPHLNELDEADLASLVGRTPLPVNDTALNAVLRDKRVLITGAGGSIGSELARIAAAHEPEVLALMERSENALFNIDREIATRFPKIQRRAILHDVVDDWGVARLLGEVRPQTVFHAAAHKHVPMMEDHPAHAVTNNVFGARSVIDASIACEAERFVLISTDKAVNPSSVMGMTKRLAEIYVLSRRTTSPTAIATVRFGNVLGSACSVLPIWDSQIRRGGPVTVTDARMTRFFMTIPEAAGLVAQAASLATDSAQNGNLFVLDMGKPVSVLELAQRFIRRYGLTPADGSAAREGQTPPAMTIAVTGARPGEKIHEELAYGAEDLSETPISGILSLATEPITKEHGDAMIGDLTSLRAVADRTRLLEVLRRWAPTGLDVQVCSKSDRASLAPAG